MIQKIVKSNPIIPHTAIIRKTLFMPFPISFVISSQSTSLPLTLHDELLVALLSSLLS